MKKQAENMNKSSSEKNGGKGRRGVKKQPRKSSRKNNDEAKQSDQRSNEQSLKSFSIETSRHKLCKKKHETLECLHLKDREETKNFKKKSSTKHKSYGAVFLIEKKMIFFPPPPKSKSFPGVKNRRVNDSCEKLPKLKKDNIFEREKFDYDEAMEMAGISENPSESLCINNGHEKDEWHLPSLKKKEFNEGCSEKSDEENEVNCFEKEGWNIRISPPSSPGSTCLLLRKIPDDKHHIDPRKSSVYFAEKLRKVFCKSYGEDDDVNQNLFSSRKYY